MIVVTVPPRAGFGRNDHREDAHHFTCRMVEVHFVDSDRSELHLWTCWKFAYFTNVDVQEQMHQMFDFAIRTLDSMH